MAVISATPRRLARKMARNLLDANKITGYNKESIGPTGKKMPSMFARRWRDLAKQAAAPTGKPRRKKK